MVWTSSKWGQFCVWSWIWPWRSRSIAPKNNRDLNQGVLLLWTKFGDPSLNRWRVIVRTSKCLIHTHTDTGNDNTRRPKLASGKNKTKQGKSEGFESCDWPIVRKRPLLGQIRRFLEPCDLEIWWMTLENNRAPLLCYFELCASFRNHWWIQTWVTVRKRPIWVKFDDF